MYSDTFDTEFVSEAFETEIDAETVEELGVTVEGIVRELRERVSSDDRLEAILESAPGEDVLTSAATVEQEDPEPVTRRAAIEPLFEGLGYPDLSVEAGDFAPDRGQQADYSVSLRDIESIRSNRLLIEAEPLGKPLDGRRHGLGQVRDWLERDKFEADFGIATDGMRWVLAKYDRDTYRFDRLARVDLQPVFLAAFENLTGKQGAPEEWLTDPLRNVLREFVRAFEYGNFRSIAGEARQAIKERKEQITDEFYDDYVRLVFGVIPDEERTAARSLIGEGIIVPEEANGDDVRLFAVELMNRLVFIKFLEDKGLVEERLLEDLRDEHEDTRAPQSFYKTYLEPLFYGIFDERPSARTERIRRIQLYSDMPYLDGGLFRPTVGDGKSFDESEFDVRDSVLTSIIELLESYSFSADGGPTDLDPSVLGNVFEKTINHITTGSGDHQKELGAYYTPDEITSFCAEETVRPALCERLADRMTEKWGWTEEMAAYDDVFELIEALPDTNVDVIEDLLGVLDRFRALDPACGSGHFLTSVQEAVVAVRKALYEKHPDDPADWQLYKETVIRNVYGVDVVEPAVEIAKLRLWLSIIAEVDPDEVDEYDEDELALPNVVFNVRQGNSLIGFTELMETTEGGEQAQLDSWGPDSVRAKYGEIIDLVEKHRQTSETEKARAYLREAEAALDRYRGDLNEKIRAEFHDAGIEDATLEQIESYTPFHWVLEFADVYANDGFDVIVGNPPWEVLSVNRDDFFSRYDPQFRSYTSREKDRVQEQLLTDGTATADGETITERWEAYRRNMENRADYFNNSPAYELQSPEVAGRAIASELDLSALFLERVFDLSRGDGRAAFVLPGNIFNGAASKDLRTHLLDESEIEALVTFENHGIFPSIHPQYKFGVTVFKGSGTTDSLYGIFHQRDLEILEELDENALHIPRRVLAEYSPKARIFPSITKQIEVDVLSKIISHPPLEEENEWWADILTKEIHEPSDKDRLFTDSSEGQYPVYGGDNIYQFCYDNRFVEDLAGVQYFGVDESDPDRSARYRVREKKFNGGDLKRALYETFEDEVEISAGSQVQFVDRLLEERRGKPLDETDVLLDCTEYRIAYRDVARATDERSLIATVLPPDALCLHTVQTFQPYTIAPTEDDLMEYPIHSAYERIFTDRELFVALGLLNSIPFDYLIRTKVDSHIVKYKMEESQLPRLTEGDDWFEYIWTRAARLNCYGEAFTEMRDRLGGIEPVTDPEARERLRAEIDAAAFHAYGLDHEETAFVLEDFHRVGNPRLMTEAYFELVLETYEELAE